MHHPVLATVITQSQMHVQIKHSLAHLQDLIPTVAGDPYFLFQILSIYLLANQLVFKDQY